MTFQDVQAQVIEWLQRDKRVSYRALKRQFDLDDDYLEDVKESIMGLFARSDEKVYSSRFGRVRNLCVKANSNAGFNHIPFDFMWLTSSFY